MKKKLRSLFLVALILYVAYVTVAYLKWNLVEPTQETMSDEARMSSVVLEHNISLHVKNLTSMGNRHVTHRNNTRAGEYIVRTLQAYGYTPIRDRFHVKDLELFNVITETRDDDQPRIVLSAHYDSKNSWQLPIDIVLGIPQIKRGVYAKAVSFALPVRAPGADDNASGVAVLLELARIFSVAPVSRNIAFAFFNSEELNAAGSKHLAKRYRQQDAAVAYMLNIDTIGFWSNRFGEDNHLLCVHNEASESICRQLQKRFAIPVKCAENLFFDDQSSFWEVGYDAIELTENATNPNMHTSNDTYDTLNFPNLYALTVALYDFLSREEVEMSSPF